MNIKDTLLSTTFELFLKYGIKSVSMDDISKKLGISKKTIYNFVATKEDLVAHILENHITKDEAEILLILKESDDAIEEMVNITKHVLKFLRKMTPSLIYDLKKYHNASWEKIENHHFAFIQDVIRKNILRGQSEGLYRDDINPEIIAKLYVSKSNCIVDEESFPLTDFNRIDLFKQMIFYHLYGIVSQKGRNKLINISIS